MTDFVDLAMTADSRDLVSAAKNIRKLAQTGMDAQDSLTAGAKAISAQWRKMAGMAGRLTGVLGLTFSSAAVLRDAEQYETRMARIGALIEATGGTAERTAEQLENQARALARASLESVDGIMGAQQVLLTFSRVTGDTFDRTISLAADMSAVFGGSMTSNTRMLARALEDPVNSLRMLGRYFPQFRGELGQTIRAMAEMGDVAGAQAAILAELEGRIGGVASAGSRLAHAKDGLGQSMEELRLALNNTLGASDAVARAVEALDSIVQTITRNMQNLRGYIIATAMAVLLYYIPAIIQAARRTGLWIASLVTLRRVLVSIGLGAFVVLMGTAINHFETLVENTGGFGNALQLLGEVASEVWLGIESGAQSLGLSLSAVWLDVQASFMEMLERLTERWSTFLMEMGASLSGAPGMGGIAESLMNRGGRTSARAAGFARSAMGLRGEAEVQREAAADLMAQGFDRAREAVDRLMEAIQRTGDEGSEKVKELVEELEELDTSIADIGDTLGASGGRARAAAADVDLLTESLEELNPAAQRVEGAFQSAFVGVITGAQDARRAVANLIMELARLAAQSAFQSLFGGMFGPLANVLSPMPSFAGGGSTGNGPRTGGVDGQGGFPAILHPQEEVIDRRRGQSADEGRQTNMKIVNVLDPAVVGDYLATAAGERMILNVMRRNGVSANG